MSTPELRPGEVLLPFVGGPVDGELRACRHPVPLGVARKLAVQVEALPALCGQVERHPLDHSRPCELPAGHDGVHVATFSLGHQRRWTDCCSVPRA